MMKIRRRFLVWAASAFFALAMTGGCTVVREIPSNLRVQKENEEQILGRELLSAFIANRPDAFLALLPEEMRERFDKKDFERSRSALIEAIGEPVSFRYVTRLELTAFEPHLWAVRFRRVNPASKKEFYSEALFRVITGRIDGRPQIVNFKFL